MPVNYVTATKTARLQTTADRLLGKTLVASTGTATNPQLVIGTSAFVGTAGTTGISSASTGVLAIIPLPNAGVTVSGSSLSLLASNQSATAGASGTAALAAVIDSTGLSHVGGLTVGGTAEGTASGKDVVLGASTISNGQTVTVTSAVITHA